MTVILNSYWDSIYDQILFNNSIALNLLYILTLSDVDRDWVLSSSEIRDQLYELQVKGNKKEVSHAMKDHEMIIVVFNLCVYAFPRDFYIVFYLGFIFSLHYTF